MDGASGMGEARNTRKTAIGRAEDLLRDLGVDGRIILKQISRKCHLHRPSHPF
jgi:hypothetical protein